MDYCSQFYRSALQFLIEQNQYFNNGFWYSYWELIHFSKQQVRRPSKLDEQFQQRSQANRKNKLGCFSLV